MQHILSGFSGNHVLGVISLLLFLSVFLGIIWVVWRLAPEYRQQMKNQPFDEGTRK